MFHLRDRIESIYPTLCHAPVTRALVPHRVTKLSEQLIRSLIPDAEVAPAKMLILNVVRDPVDIVLSAFNYHVRTDNGQEWISGKYNLARLKHLMREQYPTVIFPFMSQQNHSVFFSKYDRFLVILERNCDAYALNETQCTFQDVLRRMNMSEALQFEFDKFVYWSGYGDADEVVSSYRFIAENHRALSQRGVFVYNYRLQDFKLAFNETMRGILTRLRIDDAATLTDLMMRLQSENVNEQDRASDEHITAGTFNKTQQIAILLASHDRCETFKNWTLMLEYAWRHHDYC